MAFGVVITAAGSGTRYSNHKKKQYELLNGVPLLIHTCRQFGSISDITEKIITSDDVEKTTSLLQSFNVESYRVVKGGETRFESVKNGVLALSRVSNVLIHDAARPNISKALIHRIMNCSGNVIPGLPITDTVKWVENNHVKKTMPREYLWAVQTPQKFDMKTIKRAYEIMVNPHSFTDEAGLIESINEPVQVIDGEVTNIKITTPDDLTTLERWLNI